MKLYRNIFLSCDILAAHKLRTLLSISGIVVGVSAVILVVSFGRGAEKQILNRISSMGSNLIVVNAGQTRIIAGRERQLSTVTTLLAADGEAIARDCPSVARTSPAISKKMSTRWESENSNTRILGIASDGFRIRNITVSSGRSFTPREDRARRRVAIVGPTVVKNLFNDADPVGLSFRINRVPFEVIGVSLAKGVDANGVDQDDIIVVPLETAMRRLVNVTYVDSIYVQARNARLLDKAEAEIRELLRRRHRLRGKPDDFTIQNQATLIGTEREIARSMTLLITSVAGVSLLVGGGGIFAVMMISVRERTREIGLRRAVGASRRDVRNQFIVESGILAATGGVIGALVGLAGASAIAAFTQWATAISWTAVITGLVFSVSVGVVFGILPAVRAANLEPIQALRAE